MKIYFATSTREFDLNKQSYESITSYLQTNGHTLIPNYTSKLLEGIIPKSTPEDLIQSERQHMQDAELVLIEASVPSFGLGALFGLAVTHKKHILCLYQENNNSIEVSDVVLAYNSALAKSISYSPETLTDELDQYFKTYTSNALIKFNFTANQEVLDFIEKGANKTGKSKSEFLRDLISEDYLN
jgi:dGTP triphosphohydrolase